MRIGIHLTSLTPTVEDWKSARGIAFTSLSPRQFQSAVTELLILMSESAALNVKEQDTLSVLVANLSATAQLYVNGTLGNVLAETADQQRHMIDKVQKMLGTHGVISRQGVEVPWDVHEGEGHKAARPKSKAPP